MSEDRQDSSNGTTRRVPINLGLLHPIGTPQVTPLHALAPGAQSLPSLMIQPPRQSSLFPANDTGVQYLSQGPIGSPTVPMSQSIDPSLTFMPGTGAHAAYQAELQKAANVALSFGPGQFRAYHGTGATPFEQFLDEFIGTGEGAQAFSWGHYVAQKPGVAGSYKPEPATQLWLHGQPWEETGDWRNPHVEVARSTVDRYNGNVSAAINHLEGDASEIESRLKGRDPGFGDTAMDQEQLNLTRDAQQFLLNNQEHITHETTGGGSLLNIWVKPDHEEFLDWYLPLSKQEPEVVNKLKNLSPNDYDPDITGEEFYDRLRDEHLSNRPFPFSAFDVETAKMRASKELDAAGIPGMRFLDQQSRNLPESGLVYKGDKILPLGMLPSTTGKDWLKYKSVEEFGNDLQSNHDGWSDYVKDDPYTQQPGMMQTGGRAKLAEAREALNFFNANKSDFQMQTTPRTYNYVVYDPKNIEITHRDGERVHTLEPVDHDPWAEQKAVP